MVCVQFPAPTGTERDYNRDFCEESRPKTSHSDRRHRTSIGTYIDRGGDDVDVK